MTEPRICSACGNTVSPSDAFCPYCGSTLGDAPPQTQQGTAPANDGHRVLIILLLGIYAVPTIVLSAMFLFSANSMADTIWNDSGFQDWIKSAGIDLTLGQIKSYIVMVGGLGLAGGLCAFLSMMFVILRKYWILAVVLCLAATLLSAWSIIGLIIGIIVTWMIYRSRPSFEGESPAVRRRTSGIGPGS